MVKLNELMKCREIIIILIKYVDIDVLKFKFFRGYLN